VVSQSTVADGRLTGQQAGQRLLQAVVAVLIATSREEQNSVATPPGCSPTREHPVMPRGARSSLAAAAFAHADYRMSAGEAEALQL
jgi:hypothetical protein